MGNNPDQEEVERFAKAFSACRTCNHIMMAHSFNKQHKGRCVEAFVSITGEHKLCKCLLFIPKDNLEFLEWAAENKRKGAK